MRAAFYESDITPPLGCYQAGYEVHRLAEDVYERLHSKALVIEQDGKYAVVISVDICEYPVEMHDVVTKRIYEYTGIPAESVCIHSTHCHWGAPVTNSPQIGCYADNPYMDVFFRLVADSAILAYKRLEEVSFSFASVEVPGIANNRCSYLKDGSLKSFAPAELRQRPLTEPDHELPILFVEQNGRKIGALYSFGCHQDTVALKPYGYCSDYSGIVSNYMKEKYGQDFVSIYLAAPSGDINHVNPYVTDPSERIRYDGIGRKLFEGIESVSDKTVSVNGELKVIKEKLTIAKRKFTNEEFFTLAGKLVSENRAMELSNLVQYHRADREETAEVYVQIISIGDFSLYVYPGEMFCEYGRRTKEASPFKYNMVAENANAYGGYIPIPEAFGEYSRLYEVSPAYDSFLIPEAGEILYDEVMKLANRTKEL